MNRSVGFAAAWLAGTVVAVLIGAAAVGSVRNEVIDSPTALGAPTTTVDIPEAETSTTTEPVVAIEPVPDDVVEETTTTTSTTVPEEPVETTTTTTEPHDHEATTTTTTSAPTTTVPETTTTTLASYTKTYDVEEAGTVTIRVTGDEVTFAGAYPLEGWTFKLKNDGPEKVEVRFENNDDDEDEVTFKAKMDDGELVVDIDES